MSMGVNDIKRVLSFGVVGTDYSEGPEDRRSTRHTSRRPKAHETDGPIV